MTWGLRVYLGRLSQGQRSATCQRLRKRRGHLLHRVVNSASHRSYDRDLEERCKLQRQSSACCFSVDKLGLHAFLTRNWATISLRGSSAKSQNLLCLLLMPSYLHSGLGLENASLNPSWIFFSSVYTNIYARDR